MENELKKMTDVKGELNCYLEEREIIIMNGRVKNSKRSLKWNCYCNFMYITM